MIVSKAYCEVAKRSKYVVPIIYPGNSDDVIGAIRWAKERYEEVCAPTTYGANFPVQHRHPSFQHDQWDRAGALPLWDSIWPIMERPRNGAALAQEHLGSLPTILIGDHSESSPCPHIPAVTAALEKEVEGAYRILRLSTVKLPSVTDLLALYDRAALLISAETVHLHLAKASRVPVIALATDRPSRWHGSAYSSKFALHVRYSDIPMRMSQIIDTAKMLLIGRAWPEVKTINTQPHAYNPSILKVGDEGWLSYRFHPDQKSWRTELRLDDGSGPLPLFVDGYEQFSHEDARLFMFRGKPHVSLTLSRSAISGNGASLCATGYGELKKGVTGWRATPFIFPAYGKNQFDGQEKNLVFFENAGKLFCIWTMFPQQTVLELDGARVVQVHTSPAPVYPFGNFRGGTQPFPFRGGWLRFVHACQGNMASDEWWTYHLAAVAMESTPPFRITSISSRPILTGTEKYFPGHRFYKPRVIIPYGAIPFRDGWQVSMGINDSQCAAVNLTETDLNL
ncbi:MAG: hypothetical protein ACOYD4_03965 [Solirubrobacterales bacterium]